MKERVLFISNVTAGLVNFRIEVIRALKEKYDVYIIATDNGGKIELESLGCHFVDADFDIHGKNPLKELALILLFKKLIKRISPKIVFTYTIKPNIYAGIACSILRIPYVANITGLGTAVENGGRLSKLVISLYKMGIKNARKVYFQNTANRDFMIKHGMIRCPYEVIPGSGVNLEKFKLLDYPDGEGVHFSFISRVIKEKGIDQFIDAAKAIGAKYPYTSFHVYGTCDNEYDDILHALTDKGTIIYHGRVDNVPEVHRVSACTIHPTYYPEGMSNVLLESCASGRPIITTDRPGCREIVDDGINGFVIKQKDSSSLIAAIERFLLLDRDSRRQMGLNGRKKVETEFDRQIIINKYLEEADKC